MIFSVQIKASAEKSLRKIPKNDRVRLIEMIDRLAITPTAGGSLKGEFAGLRRVRVGKYRVIYEVVDTELVVLAIRIGHRKNVYR